MKRNNDIFLNPANAYTKFFLKQTDTENLDKYKTFSNFSIFLSKPLIFYKLVPSYNQML